jgi:hypothetical protein|nr:hypothetical protein 6 [bacterium]BDD44668.1 hypothetical protein 5 [bacterium]BDD46910.1 hypothetical protein 2 [bacterium]BDD47755.1 hypothetical protein 1 [Paracoccaceae bacterium]BDD47940.1 hypothetical protein 2 [bacterium]
MVSKSKERNRRATLDELYKLMGGFFRDAEALAGLYAHAEDEIAFALFSTRRQEEITGIRWEDLDFAR